VYLRDDGVQVELSERPRPAAERLPPAERIAIAGRRSRAPDEGSSPRICARATV
jgi:hypothetical protein